MGCTNRLICTYPGPSIRVPFSVVGDPDFQKQLAIFLEQMDAVDLPKAQAYTRKGGANHVETREPPSPLYITDFLTSILLGFGTVHDGQQFTKRIRDEVNWKSAKLPWRRSPLWLVTRVFLQLSLLSSEHEDLKKHLEYKCFMLHVFSELALAALKANFELDSELLFMINNKLARRAHKLSAHPESSTVVSRAREASDCGEGGAL